MRAAAILAVLAVLALAGCGGGEKKPAPSARSEFIAKADAVCTKSRTTSAALQRELDGIRTNRAHLSTDQLYAAAADVLRRTAQNARRAVAAVRALNPPAADRPTVERIMAVGEAGIVLVDQAAAALARHDTPAANALITRANASSRSTAPQARAFGFKVCGISP